MFAVRRFRASRSLLVALACVVTMPVLSVPGVAGADEVSTGDTVVGEFAQVWPEYEHPDEAAEHGDEGPLSYVHTADGDAVRVDTEDVEDVQIGATVELTVGREVSDTASEDLGYAEAREVVETQILEAAPAPEPTAPATAPFTNEVTVVMVNPAGGVRDATRLADVVAEVNVGVADFWEEQSNGSIKLGVTAQHDWIDTAAGCGDPYALWSEVAGRVNFVAGAGKHLMLYVTGTPSGLPGCSYGLAEVKSGPSAGGYGYVRDVETSVIAHEFGHNFGLGHSSSVQCLQSGYSGCFIGEYGDYYDVMGASWGEVGSLNVAQASRIVNVAPKIFDPTSAAETVTLTPVSQRTGTRAIVLRDSDGVRYWLEYRPASDRDAWLDTSADLIGLSPGVLLRKATTGNNTSLLLDGTPSPQNAWDDDVDAALPENTALRLDDVPRGGGAFEVTVQSLTPSAATVRVVPKSAITLAHETSGGDVGPLGVPTAEEVCGLRDGGCFRTYQNGAIYWSASTSAHIVTSPLRNRWASQGWENGRLGYPRTDTRCTLAGGGCFQHFQGGSLYVPGSFAVGVRAIAGAVRQRWAASGWENGPLGYPSTEQVCGLRDQGCFQHFQRGSIYSTPATGTRLMSVGLRQRWSELGWENGRLGYPVTDQICGLPDGGCFVHFQGGSIYVSGSTGAHEVSGPVRDRWAASGWERGQLGYPTTHPACGLRDGGCFQHFQGGSIYWSPADGARIIHVPVRNAWAAIGWERGPLGYPRMDTACGLRDGGCFQTFQGGAIYFSPATGAHALTGRLREAWAATGWEHGYLGYPVDGRRYVLNGESQRFQGGTLFYDYRTGRVRRI